jgi:hypothetical protein
MNGGFDFGILILGLGALAFLVGLGAWIWEFLANRKVQIPEQQSVELGIIAPEPPFQNTPLHQSTIKQPVIPKKESTGFDVATAPLHSPHIPEKTEIPPAQSLQIQKTPLISSSPPSKLKTAEHAPELLRPLPSVSNHKKENKEKARTTTPEVPRSVKKQAPLPEYGGMCSKCGENPKVPGNDGFCKDCSPLD